MRWVFHATAGFLGRVDSQTQCGVWAEEPADHGFDPGRLITVDLARTPTAAAAKQIGFREVEVDDCFVGPNGVVSGTTLGPAWPELRMAGVVYLEHGFTASLPAATSPACPPPGGSGQACEYITAVYWPGSGDLRAGSRYAGHYTQILEERGTLARVAVHPRGRSGQPTASPVTMWIDLASPEHCDAGIDSPTRTAPPRQAPARPGHTDGERPPCWPPRCHWRPSWPPRQQPWQRPPPRCPRPAATRPRPARISPTARPGLAGHPPSARPRHQIPAGSGHADGVAAADPKIPAGVGD